MIRIEDCRHHSTIEYTYTNNLNDAEDMATRIMDSMEFRWCRCEWSDNLMEYAKYPAVGTCRIFVRIIREHGELYCDTCQHELAKYRIPDGQYCNICYVKRFEKHD